MKIVITLTLFALCVAGAIIAHMTLTPPPAHSVVAVDISASIERDCVGLRKEGERLLSHSAIQPGSTVTLLAIGRSGLDPEPTRLFDKALPIESDDVFGRDESAFARERQAFMGQLQKSCESAAATKSSPVLRLITQSLAHLRSRGCKAGGPCFLTVQTDMEEDVEPALRAAIQRAAKRPTIELPTDLAGSLDNAGIEVKFCGSSDARPRAKQSRAAPATLARLWKAMFTRPELVSFQPYCGQ